MAEKIKFTISDPLPAELLKHSKRDLIAFKNRQLIKVFYKINRNKKRTGLRNGALLSDNFKKNWFCKDCLNLFHLKPLRKYKTLLEYIINCPACRSANTIHNEDISEAILNKKTPEELLLLNEDRINLCFNIHDVSKYSIDLFSTGKSKQGEVVDKQFLYLDNFIDTGQGYSS